jgi:cold shock CspA family protein
MQKPLELSFRGVKHTQELDKLIRSEVAKLERVCSYIIGCKVAVEKVQQSQHKGNPFRVRVDVTVPHGHEIVARNKYSKGQVDRPLTTVIHETFDNERDQLKELVQRQHHNVKEHTKQKTNGIVVKVFEQEGYGFIRSMRGEEVYFHKNSVLHNNFKRITVGTGVRYTEEMGHKGPQASTVKIVNKPGY